jgi:hypothetical protein
VEETRAEERKERRLVRVGCAPSERVSANALWCKKNRLYSIRGISPALQRSGLQTKYGHALLVHASALRMHTQRQWEEEKGKGMMPNVAIQTVAGQIRVPTPSNLRARLSSNSLADIPESAIQTLVIPRSDGVECSITSGIPSHDHLEIHHYRHNQGRHRQSCPSQQRHPFHTEIPLDRGSHPQK